MRTINFADTRNNLLAVMAQVVKDGDVTISSRAEGQGAVVMSFDYKAA